MVVLVWKNQFGIGQRNESIRPISGIYCRFHDLPVQRTEISKFSYEGEKKGKGTESVDWQKLDNVSIEISSCITCSN